MWSFEIDINKSVKIWTGKFLIYLLMLVSKLYQWCKKWQWTYFHDHRLRSQSAIFLAPEFSSFTPLFLFYLVTHEVGCSNVDNTVSITIKIIVNWKYILQFITIKNFINNKQSFATRSRFHLDCCLVYLLLAGPAGGACSDVTCAGVASPVMSNNAISPAPQINLNN
jgi:hypothetical protein